MNNLIKANISAMWRSKAFLGCLIPEIAAACIFGFASMFVPEWDVTDGLIQLFLFPMFAAAVFSALFIGTEYSEKTIRNKMIIGKTRTQIYLADLISVFIGSLVITAAHSVCIMIVSIPFGFAPLPENFALKAVICICELASLCSVMTLIAANISKRAVTSVLALVFTFGTLIAAEIIETKVQQPETRPSHFYNEDGEYEGIVEIPNDYAPSKTERAVLQTVFNILPFGGLKSASSDEPDAFFTLYSLGVISVTTAAGVLLFRKKDIK